jgi:hypothetical protein
MFFSPFKSYFYDNYSQKNSGGLENLSNRCSKPGNVLFIQAVAGRRAFYHASDPTGLAQNLEVLGNGGLGDGQELDDVASNVTRMGHQKFHDLKAMGVPQSFEHGHQSLLLRTRDVQRAAGNRDSGRFLGWRHGFSLSSSYFYDKSIPQKRLLVKPQFRPKSLKFPDGKEFGTPLSSAVVNPSIKRSQPPSLGLRDPVGKDNLFV